MLPYYINKIFKKLNLIIIFRNGKAIGEIVYLTSLINCLYSKNNKYKIIIITKYPEILFYNKKIFLNLKFYNNFFYRLIFYILCRITGSNIIDFNPEKKQLDNDIHFLKSYPINTHLTLVVSKYKLDLKTDSLKNEIFFSNIEKKIFEKKLLLPNEYAITHSQAKLTYAKNKDWGYQNMQKVINLTPKITWVQVGLSSEPLLENSIHRLNISLRELAYIIFRSKFVLTLEGLYNHLASCFDKKTFIILSGMLPVAASYYKNNVVISKFEDLDCAPCYRLNNCIKSDKLCTTRITPEYVVNMINKNF
jgi:hypothetical protein